MESNNETIQDYYQKKDLLELVKHHKDIRLWSDATTKKALNNIKMIKRIVWCFKTANHLLEKGWKYIRDTKDLDFLGPDPAGNILPLKQLTVHSVITHLKELLEWVKKNKLKPTQETALQKYLMVILNSGEKSNVITYPSYAATAYAIASKVYKDTCQYNSKNKQIDGNLTQKEIDNWIPWGALLKKLNKFTLLSLPACNLKPWGNAKLFNKVLVLNLFMATQERPGELAQAMFMNYSNYLRRTQEELENHVFIVVRNQRFNNKALPHWQWNSSQKSNISLIPTVHKPSSFIHVGKMCRKGRKAFKQIYSKNQIFPIDKSLHKIICIKWKYCLQNPGTQYILNTTATKQVHPKKLSQLVINYMKQLTGKKGISATMIRKIWATSSRHLALANECMSHLERQGHTLATTNNYYKKEGGTISWKNGIL